MAQPTGPRSEDQLFLISYGFTFECPQRRCLCKRPRRAIWPQYHQTRDDLFERHAVDRGITEFAENGWVRVCITLRRVGEVDLFVDAVENACVPFFLGFDGFELSSERLLRTLVLGPRHEAAEQCGSSRHAQGGLDPKGRRVPDQVSRKQKRKNGSGYCE